ncbi:pentapeptide repeat-containing protein [Deinococcus sp.]|uniref:pentapeptide repeat-containing protein n=1 Tax=Deinococcus sp. TaxID=47478 RepID=UPI0038D3A7CF
MLAGVDLSTRVGGIALLGQVAQSSADRRDVAVRLLAAFMRVNSPVTQSGRLQTVNHEPPAEEDRAVFAALAFRGNTTNVDMGRISAPNLMSAGTDFRELVFSRSDLSGGLVEGSDFTGDVFRGATLRNVTFRAANLTGTNFSEADMSGSIF